MVLSAASILTRKNNKTNDSYSLDTKAFRQLLVPLARYQLSAGSVMYVAEAEPGTALTDTNWRVWRQTVTSTTVRIEWANGSGAFENAANNMAGLSYS